MGSIFMSVKITGTIRETMKCLARYMIEHVNLKNNEEGKIFNLIALIFNLMNLVQLAPVSSARYFWPELFYCM